MLTSEPVTSTAEPKNFPLAKAMTMIVFPLRRRMSEDVRILSAGEGQQTLLDMEPSLFRADELDVSFMENVYGTGADRLKRLKGQRVFASDQSPGSITVALDFFILRGKSHLEAGPRGSDQGITDFFLAFASFDRDTDVVGEICLLLHRPSKCTSETVCISRGHSGLCIRIRAEIADAIRDLISGFPEETAAGRVPLSFTLRGDGNFALKEGVRATPDNGASSQYLPQRGRAHALVVSRFARTEMEPTPQTHDGRSFFWYTDPRVWVLSKSGKTTGLPNKMLDSSSGERKSKHYTLFNDVTVPILLVIQQAYAIAELRFEFSALSTRRHLDVLEQAQMSRSFARDLLVFRSATWVTNFTFSPDLTDYLNDVQNSLRLGRSYDSLMGDFSHWNSHLELLAQVQQSNTSEKNAAFLTILSICIAAGALWLEQGSIPAISCSAVAILGAFAFLFKKGLGRKERGKGHP